MKAVPLDYAAAVAALRSRGRFGISLGLERIRALLDELDHPEASLRGALVAGTNGKGSVVALTAAVLHEAGLRIGTMPKPHLVSYRERIAVDQVPLGEERFAAAIRHVLPAIDRVSARLGPPTEFEALTAAAVAELARSRVDLVVVEVGLGGRLDATNALDPGVAVITNVAHDHEKFLGRTLAAIGAEKAAIIKAANLVVTGATGRGLRPIEERAAVLRAPLRRAGASQPYRATVRHAGWDGLTVDLETPGGPVPNLHIGLLGSHQAANAAVAAATLDALAESAAGRGESWRITDAALRTGFATARWPGRLELLEATARGRVLLDGAHNPAGGRALARALAELGVHDVPMVFGAMRDKRISAVLRALAPLRPRPVFTAVSDGHAEAPAALLRRWQRLAPGGMVAETPGQALRLAADLRSAPDQPILVAGSLYLVGAVRGMLTGEVEPG